MKFVICSNPTNIVLVLAPKLVFCVCQAPVSFELQNVTAGDYIVRVSSS